METKKSNNIVEYSLSKYAEIDYLQRPCLIIEKGIQSVNAIHQYFKDQRSQKDKLGNTTDSEQDLLRAMLVFAGATMDASIKELIKTGRNKIIRKEKIEEFVKRELSSEDNDKINTKLIAQALLKDDPAEFLLNKLVDNLIGDSLQSTEQLKKIGTYLNIEFPKHDEVVLKSAFNDRNKIIHEMDADLSGVNRKRNQKNQNTIFSQIKEIFKLAQGLVIEAANK